MLLEVTPGALLLLEDPHAARTAVAATIIPKDASRLMPCRIVSSSWPSGRRQPSFQDAHPEAFSTFTLWRFKY
jgi:hypothetical protein